MKKKLILRVQSEETFNVNITSTLMELYKQVKDNWTRDYYNSGQIRNSTGTNGVEDKVSNFRRRSPFVPFALQNETGSVLKFTTHVSDVDNAGSSFVYKSNEHWITVNPGETVPFTFRSRGKIFDEKMKVLFFQIIFR